jgi:uncharacterized membrane protein
MTGQIEDSEPAVGAVTAGPVSEVDFISAERLIFFSDAVVAIAITLLAFALPLPQHVTSDSSNAAVWNAVWAHRIDYLTFLISFAVIGRHWRLHHRLFRDVYRLDTQIVTLNMVWLLMIVVIPFATRLISGAGGFGVRFTVYAAIQVLTMLTFLLMGRHLRSGELVRPGPAASARDGDAVLLTVAALFAVSIPVAFVTQWAFALWVASVPAARALGRRLDRDGNDERDRGTSEPPP